MSSAYVYLIIMSTVVIVTFILSIIISIAKRARVKKREKSRRFSAEKREKNGPVFIPANTGKRGLFGRKEYVKEYVNNTRQYPVASHIIPSIPTHFYSYAEQESNEDKTHSHSEKELVPNE